MSLIADDELLERLRAALQTTGGVPTSEEVAAVRAAVVGPRGVVVPLRKPGRHRRLLVAAAAAALVVTGGATAFAVGAPLPRLMRSAASSVGLPVGSPESAGARAALAGLRRALAGRDDVQLARAVHVFTQRVRGLPGDERRELTRQGAPLLRRAEARLREDEEREPPSGTRDGDEPDAAAPGVAGGDRGGERSTGDLENQVGDSTQSGGPSASASEPGGSSSFSGSMLSPSGDGTDGGSSGVTSPSGSESSGGGRSIADGGSTTDSASSSGA